MGPKGCSFHFSHGAGLPGAVIATYREHGHALLRGVSAGRFMAEMYGRAEGCSRGRGGSMHLFDAATRFYGGNAIVGGHLPVAVGLALADKMMGRRGRATICFFGEGAMAEGEFHEAMNLAALWDVPVLFCCENNLYAMGTSLATSESQLNLTLKAASYEMPAWSVELSDYLPDFGIDDAVTNREIRIWHLLTHTPGWEGQLGTPDRGPATLTSFVDTMRSNPALARPGEVWSYNNAGWGVAGRVIEVVTESSINDALDDLVFDPLGLDRAFSRTGEAMTLLRSPRPPRSHLDRLGLQSNHHSRRERP